MSAALAPADRERFAVQLASSASEAELQAWFDGATPGKWAVYAAGPMLPADAAGVRLVRGWEAAGLVNLSQQRDPLDVRRWQYVVSKVAGRATGSACLSASENGRERSGANGAAVPSGRSPAPSGPLRNPATTATRSAERATSSSGAKHPRAQMKLLAAFYARNPEASHADAAKALGLTGRRGIERARYLLVRLVREGRASVATDGTARRVTIKGRTAPGSHAVGGKDTP
ncbi:hypothetical protein ACWPMX_07900 [Tsuneonella sp. HG094]